MIKNKTMKLEEIKEQLDIIQDCFEEAPIDFLGTGENSRAAKKEENEWYSKWQSAVSKIKEKIASLSESHKAEVVEAYEADRTDCPECGGGIGSGEDYYQKTYGNEKIR